MNKCWMVVALLLSSAACEEANSCDAYVDYICDCHANDASFDCEGLRTSLANASADVQDQCTIDLEDQEQADDDSGYVCGS